MLSQRSSSLRKRTKSKRKYPLIFIFLYLIDVFDRLGDLLLEKETINLKDIIEVLGARPAGMNETMTEYLTELTERLEQEEQQAKLDAEQPAEEEPGLGIDATEDQNTENTEEKEPKEKEDK